jgi:hypothetical protein
MSTLSENMFGFAIMVLKTKYIIRATKYFITPGINTRIDLYVAYPPSVQNLTSAIK